MYTYSLAHFNYFVVAEAATKRCFLKMAVPNKLINSLGNTCEGFVFLVKLQSAVLLGMGSFSVVFQGFCRYL